MRYRQPIIVRLRWLFLLMFGMMVILLVGTIGAATTGKEIDGSGISNKPYVIDGQNKDRYPLIQPFSSSFLVNYEQEVTPLKFQLHRH